MCTLQSKSGRFFTAKKNMKILKIMKFKNKISLLSMNLSKKELFTELYIFDILNQWVVILLIWTMSMKITLE